MASKKKDAVSTGMEYMLHMRQYLGEDKTSQFIEERFAHKPFELRQKVKGIINKMHAIRHKPEPQLKMPLV